MRFIEMQLFDFCQLICPTVSTWKIRWIFHLLNWRSDPEEWYKVRKMIKIKKFFVILDNKCLSHLLVIARSWYQLTKRIIWSINPNQCVSNVKWKILNLSHYLKINPSMYNIEILLQFTIFPSVWPSVQLRPYPLILFRFQSIFPVLLDMPEKDFELWNWMFNSGFYLAVNELIADMTQDILIW